MNFIFCLLALIFIFRNCEALMQLNCLNDGVPSFLKEHCDCPQGFFCLTCEFRVEGVTRKLSLQAPITGNIKLKLCNLFSGEIAKVLDCDVNFSPGISYTQDYGLSNSYDPVPIEKTMQLVGQNIIEFIDVLKCKRAAESEKMIQNFICLNDKKYSMIQEVYDATVEKIASRLFSKVVQWKFESSLVIPTLFPTEEPTPQAVP
uniref:Uncharacterized protein n=1 Tax=Panagrolaimus sp. PS1159 TaxID=55785 RepID=A0AC35GFX7_9BILA